MTIAATPLSIGFEECGLEALKELAGLKLRLFARPCLRAVSEAYDAQNDFLTQVDYNDGQANEVQNWDYDAAGNRGSYISNIPGAQWTYDNLNRIVTSPIGSYAHDMAGNRLTGPGQTLSWDVTNRLTGLNGVTHRYRNDGMRVQKVAANGDTYRWHYDAQMPVEETRVVGGQTTVMRNIVGPRGIDIQFDGSNAAFPLYDTHGNAKALLARSGSTFTTTAWRQYDVWGSLRTGSALGGASQRYCANLGHVTDDESGLVYMRARFYEPWTGRFVSEDPARDGGNWYGYCMNSPTTLVDQDGRQADPINDFLTSQNVKLLLNVAGLALWVASVIISAAGRMLGVIQITWLMCWFNQFRFASPEMDTGPRKLVGLVLGLMVTTAGVMIGESLATHPALHIAAVVGAYVGFIQIFLTLEGVASGEGW